MTTEREEDPGRDLKIADYLTGELAGAELAAFERAMAADVGLAEDVAAARAVLAAVGDWMESPPGAEQADGLLVPELEIAATGHAILRPAAGPARVVDARPARRSWIWQAMAAAAMLAVGFWAGRASEPNMPAKNDFTRGQTAERAGGPTSATANVPAAAAKDNAFGKIAIPASPAGAGERLASLPQEDEARARPVRSVRDEDGKLVLETTLPSSGVHATWVIDGGFQMAKADARSNQGERP